MQALISNRPLFGMKPPEDPSQEPECCKKRKLGIPVGCCPPLPPDQLVKLTSPEKPVALAEPKGIFSRMLAGIGQWFQAFFAGLWADFKLIFFKS